jgi:hypothetical protein
MRTRVLLVEPDPNTAATLNLGMGLSANVEVCADFSGARARLLGQGFYLLITNLRLRAFNGLHLVYLARSQGSRTRSVVYTDRRSASLARDVQQAGAFYEWRDRLPYAFAGYVSGNLPEVDRRNPEVVDRRRVFRGGRRCCDVIAFPV